MSNPSRTSPPDAPTEAPAPPGRRRGWRRSLKRITLIIAAFYLAIIALLFFLQEALIFPGRASQGQAYSAIRPWSDCQLVTLKTPDGHKVAALFGPALSPIGAPLQDARERPALLYFYGNGECLGGSHDKLNALRRRGVNVLMVDYLGYGQSEGTASETGCKAAALAAYEHLATRTDIDPRKILIGGFSLGGAVAIDLAAKKPCSGLMVCCSFTSLPEMAWSRYPMLALPFLLRHKFPSREAIAKVKVPTLVSYGALDRLIPPAMSDALASSAGGPVVRIAMKGAGHDDIAWVADEDREVGRALDAFLDKLR